MGFGLVIRFVAHLQLVTSVNYSTIANSHTLLLTTAHATSSMSSLGVTWKRIPTILSCMRRLYKTGFGLATGFIGSQYSTLNYSVNTLQLTRN
jgi:hypothetical protein